MSGPTSVVIDGVRYVPAREAVVGIDDLREALLDVWWGEGYRGSNPDTASEGMTVIVSDDGEGTPLDDFIDGIAAKLTRDEKAPPG